MFKRKQEPATVEEQSPSSFAKSATSGPEASLRNDLGLYHLWYLEKRLREELARGARTGSAFSLAAWRLRLLPGETLTPDLASRAAEIITGALRNYDVPSRIEVDRFVAILFDAQPQDASTVAFRIKGDLQLRAASAGRWQAGVASFPQDGVDGEALIQATFRRLQSDARAA